MGYGDSLSDRCIKYIKEGKNYPNFSLYQRPTLYDTLSTVVHYKEKFQNLKNSYSTSLRNLETEMGKATQQAIGGYKRQIDLTKNKLNDIPNSERRCDEVINALQERIQEIADKTRKTTKILLPLLIASAALIGYKAVTKTDDWA